jgi:hypothetical protein
MSNENQWSLLRRSPPNRINPMFNEILWLKLHRTTTHPMFSKMTSYLLAGYRG